MSLDQFIRLADNIIEFEADLNENKFPITPVHALEVHRCELKTLWTRLRTAYETFLSEAEKERGDGGEDIDIESFKLKYKSTYSTYCNCLTKLSELYESITQSASSRQSVASQQGENNIVPNTSKIFQVENNPRPEAHSLYLPPIDIEPFHGDYSSWPTFRDIFTAVVSNSRASNVEKLFFLIRKTTGEARDIVKKSPLTNQGFELAWASLCDRYENRRILVNGQLKILFGLQTIASESCRALKQLQREINSCVSILRLYNIDVTSWDPIFVFICTSKLPESTLTLWEQQLKDTTAIPKWSELNDFLTNRYRTLESVQEIRSPGNSQNSETKSKKLPSSESKKVKSFQTNVSGFQCQLCIGESHAIRKCPKFLGLDYQHRLEEIKKRGLCLNCFSRTHSVRNCTSNNSCFKCQKRHNTLLHRDANISIQNSSGAKSSGNVRLNPNSTPFTKTNSNNPQSTSLNRIQNCFASHSKNVLLGTAIVDICHGGIRYKARALIDSGSEGTFISERLCNVLKLTSRPSGAQISGLNNSVSVRVRRECTFTLGTLIDDSIEIPVTALIVPHLTNNLPSQTLPSSIQLEVPDIRLADPKFYVSSKIDLLIGGDIFPSIICRGIKHNICGTLIGQETIFGWILTGPVSHNSPLNTTVVSYFCEISLDKEISRFWEVENLPRKNFLSPSDKACEELYIRTTRRNSDGRYVVSLPFKEEFPEELNLGHSRSRAMAQFFRNEARLSKTPNIKEEYDAVVQEYEKLGHMVRIQSSELQDSPNVFYLPHHAVVKPESVTTKVRVVFNASAPSSNSLSLNSVLHIGPILQSDLTLLILKWRFFKYVFNADIQKMYRQILVDANHTPYQRIVFRKDPNSPILDYELQTVTFGVNCAPYLAIRTLLQLATDVESEYPVASAILRDSIYVDDVLAGAHTIQGALTAKRELVQALHSAGFPLRKWTSNSKDILADIPYDHLLHEDFLKFENTSAAKTLGIRWNACSDEFYFSTNKLSNPSKYTKREVLSQIAKLFDPAGWLSPCIVLAKILMQNIWRDGTDWDETISPVLLREWKTFQSNYSYIDAIRIPRWVDYSPSAEVQFHGFCDASEKAYAAALYVRIEYLGSVSTHLIASKTKVSPIKTLSIPRLELCGAVLLSEMLDSLLPGLEVKNYSIFCWTDSTIVLSWLAKPPSSWMTFVANRVSKISQVIDFSQWSHVNSEANPADLASRGVYPQYLVDNELWWCGPHWLKKDREEWPRSKFSNIPHIDLERKRIQSFFSYFSNFDDLLERFSSFSRAMRVMAYVYRFIYRTYPRSCSNFQNKSISLTNTEINSVRLKLVSICQRAYYPNEYKALSDQHCISKSSSILNLNPFLDAEGIIRSCGRLESSHGLTYNEKHPIILPYNSQYSRLLIRFIHDVSLHGGNQLVLRLLRSQFWIPKAKNLIKTIINKCKVCLVYRKRCQRQIMAALPHERTELTRPFTHTGLDFAGPFDIKSYSGRACRISKGYVCIFVCFSTKAIHLEATSDLSTQAFLAAFARFVSRRGCPLHLHSDNGTTFVGASKILAREFLQTSQARLLANYSHQNISWHFIPAGAPHMGGLWEAGVKSFKAHFRKVTGPNKYTFEEFSTLLSRIESCLNSRPISPMTTNSTDLCALTPGHFLIGGPILAPVDPQVADSRISLVNRWQKLKLIYQTFCARWKNEYLKEMHKRNKWQSAEEDIKEGALVVIKEENLPPNSWRLGRVAKVFPGADNRVRVANIVTQKGQITRPIVKLILLPMCNLPC